MAYRQLYSESAFATPGTDRFEFAVPTNGATTPVASGVRGSGATITRTGVGIMSVVFDLIFMFQHYVLNRHAPTTDHK